MKPSAYCKLFYDGKPIGVTAVAKPTHDPLWTFQRFICRETVDIIEGTRCPISAGIPRLLNHHNYWHLVNCTTLTPVYRTSPWLLLLELNILVLISCRIFESKLVIKVYDRIRSDEKPDYTSGKRSATLSRNSQTNAAASTDLKHEDDIEICSIELDGLQLSFILEENIFKTAWFELQTADNIRWLIHCSTWVWECVTVCFISESYIVNRKTSSEIKLRIGKPDSIEEKRGDIGKCIC
jgi:hypothetical protein